MSARTALAGSLNVPAVRTLLLVGVEPFRDRLWDTGYRGLAEDGAYYGFSLALGSAEVTLLEQADAYRALANGGRWSPLRLTRRATRAGAARRSRRPQAAWIVADMMADPDARAATFGLDSALRLPFWAAVKTGTSKAMRDNWCVGFTRSLHRRGLGRQRRGRSDARGLGHQRRGAGVARRDAGAAARRGPARAAAPAGRRGAARSRFAGGDRAAAARMVPAPAPARR